jgi:hypothetical protein
VVDEAPTRRRAARAWSTASSGGEERVRERYLGEGEMDGARSFIERGEERERCQGRERPAMAINGHQWRR